MPNETNENILVDIDTEQMQGSQKLLGMKIDSKLDFEDHIGRICTKKQCEIKWID